MMMWTMTNKANTHKSVQQHAHDATGVHNSTVPPDAVMAEMPTSWICDIHNASRPDNALIGTALPRGR